MSNKLTPMMAQYFETKKQNPDTILMYRLGDFYEMFYDDAILASKELSITLTGRSCGQDEKAPMCGVPYHAVDTYISRLVSKGYKVSICEQMEDAKEVKGIVKREIVRTITPGTIIDDGILNSRKTNYMCSIYKEGENYSLALADVSTGEVLVTYVQNDPFSSVIISELQRFSPVEIILNFDSFQNKELKNFINGRTEALSFTCDEAWFSYKVASNVLKTHFGENAGEILKNSMITGALGALMQYLIETQKTALSHIREIKYFTVDQYMSLDAAAQRNLELVETLREKSKRGSLLWVLDKTSTSMGARTLKSYILQPLLNSSHINERLMAVQELIENNRQAQELIDAMKEVLDVERLMSKISLGTANPRDLVALKASFSKLPIIKNIVSGFVSPLLRKQAGLVDSLYDLYDLIERGIIDMPPITVREGGIIKEGFNEEVDRLNDAMKNGKGFIADLEAKERENTGIKNLKIGFNKVFGYYIEISNSNTKKVPDNYMRKQTLTNGERYITPELKEIEDMVLGAEEKITALEYKVFMDIKNIINNAMDRVQRTAKAIGVIDVLCSFKTVAVNNNYTMPIVDQKSVIDIKDGRHPVVEKMLKDSLFVPNDTYIDTQGERLSIITGPNMAGKSTYMRQVSLIVLMAQIGSFVPAKSATIGVVDKIFTRVGASDDLAAGMSTFMVEMSEVKDILLGATAKSLIILDEIGRGTSTYDGLAIAWAVVEHCCKKIGAKTLFATHYHELTELEGKLDGANNYCIAVKKRGDDISFLRKIIRGGADGSYGIEVAKIAGLPDAVINRAKKILADIEKADINKPVIQKNVQQTAQIGFEGLVGQDVIDELKRIDVTTLSPIEALNKLYELQRKVIN